MRDTSTKGRSISTTPEGERGWQKQGLRGADWWVASLLLTKDQRQQLADMTPDFDSSDSGWNATGTWNSAQLRWEQDFYGDPERKGHVGPHAILPFAEAVRAYAERSYGKLKTAKLSELRKLPGFVMLPPGASIGHSYGGDDAVWDLYWEPKYGPPDLVVRGHVGGVQDQADSFTSRSLFGVASKGFKRNDSQGGSSFVAYLVPHDMSEPVTMDDDALKPYAEYRKQHAEDLARRGPAPHASAEDPRDGYLRVDQGSLLRFQGGDWHEVATLPGDMPNFGNYQPSKCVRNGSAVFCFDREYWRIGLLVGLTVGQQQAEAYYAVDAEPWPQGVWDEDTLVGVAANKQESEAYYNYPKSPTLREAVTQ